MLPFFDKMLFKGKLAVSSFCYIYFLQIYYYIPYIQENMTEFIQGDFLSMTPLRQICPMKKTRLCNS